MEPEAQQIFHRAAHYFLEGLAASTSSEVKTISLLTCLEIIDGARSLDRRAVADTLGIPDEEADLIRRVRNHVLHDGLSLSAAVRRARTTQEQHGMEAPTGFLFGEGHFPGSYFYFKLAQSMSRYWPRIVGFGTPPNDFLETLDDISARSRES